MAAFSSSRRASRSKKHGPLLFICCIVIFVVVYASFVKNSYSLLRQKQQEQSSSNSNNYKGRIPRASKPQAISGNNKKKAVAIQTKQYNKKDTTQCQFRDYPKRRYYGLPEASQPDFLQDAEYIYGKFPIVLPTSNSPGNKLCVNQTEWRHSISTTSNKLPFADGTNPSILALSRVPSLQQHQHSHDATYLATLCMTNSLCSWKDSDQDREEYNISSQDKPDTVRTLLLWLDDEWNTLVQSTIYLERNAQWGRRNPVVKQEKNGEYSLDIKPLDDARLFLHANNVWISYRDGPNFGYDKQVLNPLHFMDEKVMIRASESVPFCCGRNMALMEHVLTRALQSLTWVDPVTVIDVDVSKVNSKRRRLTEQATSVHRRLENKRESHFHGTNAFLVPYNNNKELLGIGHFHRPPGRDANEYSRHGHHYTHAFFTISSDEPYRLKRLSAEFVFPSKQYPQDAAIIQFASGLELDQVNGKVVIAYGINDCEAGAVYVDLRVVEDMLKPVKEGQQVLDVMQKVEAVS